MQCAKQPQQRRSQTWQKNAIGYPCMIVQSQTAHGHVARQHLVVEGETL